MRPCMSLPHLFGCSYLFLDMAVQPRRIWHFLVNVPDHFLFKSEIRPFADDLDAVRFNRNKINRRLSKLNLASPALEPEVI